MDSTVLFAVIAGLIGILIFLLKDQKSNETEKPKSKPLPRSARPGGKNVRKTRNIIEESDSGEASDDLDELIEKSEKQREKRRGVKYAAKMEAKEEKRLAREQEAKERLEAKKEEEKIYNERLEAEKREQEAEKAEEERLKKIEEERLKKEQEEYEKMMVDFEIEDEGIENTQENLESEADMLIKFIDHVRSKKICVLDELASEFGLKTQECIDRVKSMLDDETLTGVIDDRGKFIYVTKDELKKVAKYINNKGRVSKVELSKNSGSLITLDS